MAPKIHSYLDASESIFAARELEHVRTTLYEVEYRELKGRFLVPIDNTVNPGAETVKYNVMDQVGSARVGGGYSRPGPRVDVTLSEVRQAIKPITNSYGYSIQELRAARLAGRPIDALRARVAREVMERKLNALLLSGDTAEGFAGLFSLSGTTTYTIAAGVLGSLLWSQKTADEIACDLSDAANTVVEATEGREIPDTLVLPLTAYNHINKTRMGDGSDKTILAYFLETSLHVRNVEWAIELETAGAGSTRRMMVYKKDPVKLQAVIPQEFEQFAPQEVGYEAVVNCHMRYGGIELRYPASVAYGDAF